MISRTCSRSRFSQPHVVPSPCSRPLCRNGTRYGYGARVTGSLFQSRWVPSRCGQAQRCVSLRTRPQERRCIGTIDQEGLNSMRRRRASGGHRDLGASIASRAASGSTTPDPPERACGKIRVVAGCGRDGGGGAGHCGMRIRPRRALALSVVARRVPPRRWWQEFEGGIISGLLHKPKRALAPPVEIRP